jgi:hypothetical protein
MRGAPAFKKAGCFFFNVIVLSKTYMDYSNLNQVCCPKFAKQKYKSKKKFP